MDEFLQGYHLGAQEALDGASGTGVHEMDLEASIAEEIANGGDFGPTFGPPLANGMYVSRPAKDKQSDQGYFTRAVEEELNLWQPDLHPLGQRDGRTERDTERDAEIALELQKERERKEEQGPKLAARREREKQDKAMLREVL
jgi:hypothetical protein